jgi:uncharacterized protein (DUF983 family)
VKAKIFAKAGDEWLTSTTSYRVVLFLLLAGHFCCGFFIWFYHNPGLKCWVVLPIINGLFTFWLLAEPYDLKGWKD